VAGAGTTHRLAENTNQPLATGLLSTAAEWRRPAYAPQRRRSTKCTLTRSASCTKPRTGTMNPTHAA
jgi:hypothetical protein